MEDFFGEIVTNNECGAFIRIIKFDEIDQKKLTKKYVYKLMWPNNEIGENFDDSFEFDDKTFVYENDQKSHMAYVQLDPKLLKLKVTKFKTSLKVANEKDQVKIDKIALDSEHPMAQLIALQRTSNQKIFKKIAKEGSSKYALGVAYE